MKDHLKLRTGIVALVVLVFACAIHPLTQKDFLSTFLNKVPENNRPAAEKLVNDTRKMLAEKPGLYPASTLLAEANRNNVDLASLTGETALTDNSAVIALVRKEAESSIRLGLDLAGGVEYVLDLRPDFERLSGSGVSRVEAEKKLKENFQTYRDLAMEALRKRLESQNIFESEIIPFSATGLSLKAPIVSTDEKDKLQKLIQASSKLEFRLVHHDSATLIAQGEYPPPGYELLTEQSAQQRSRHGEKAISCIVAKQVQMNGDTIKKAFVSRSQYGTISISLEFNAAGAKLFGETTGRNIGRQLAIVLDGKMYCAPVIQSRIDAGRAEITGSFSSEDAKLIADALTSGSFPFRIDVAAVYDTAPTLGADNVANGVHSGLWALALLGIFMIAYYRIPGVIAVIALSVNVILILGAMAAFGATLTMPGIAGIILTLGMALDANVLVFERMREELEQGKSADTAIRMGFERAFSAMIDGNLTTLLAAVILMYFGTGAVKGFAVTLAIGILSSLFTALFMSRVLFDWMTRLWKTPNLSMAKLLNRPHNNFLRQSRIAVPVSIVIIALSVALFCVRGENMLSVDFTGGTLLGYDYN
ncbi:MAG: protein translocase subunit SecD, partial [Victivallaceae bacterium]|nr:protein translocase subunit SecD [Victivallaceae bacterium]